MLRFPRHVLDPPTARRYCRSESARVRAKGDVLILSFDSEEESGDGWDDDGSGWLASLVPVRGDIAAGDYRALYLAWLLGVQHGELASRFVAGDTADVRGEVLCRLEAVKRRVEVPSVRSRTVGDLLAAAARRRR